MIASFLGRRFAAPVALLGIATLGGFLSGCGGASTNSEQIVPTRNAGPTVYGLQQEAAAQAGDIFQASGLISSDGLTALVVGAVDYTGTPIATQDTGNGKIALGFAPGGTYLNGDLGAAAAPGASVIFGAYVANGIDAATGNVVPINPSGVTLTTRRPDGSEEVPGFSVPLTFGLGTSGPLANAQYRTAPFALPFAATGLHSLAVTVTDARGASNPLGTSTTYFDAVVLAPGDAALIAQVLDEDEHSVPGATVTITNPISGARAQTTADDQGVVVLFAAPGTQTVTVSGEGFSFSTEVVLTAGKVRTSAETNEAGDPQGTDPFVLAPPSGS